MTIFSHFLKLHLFKKIIFLQQFFQFTFLSIFSYVGTKRFEKEKEMYMDILYVYIIIFIMI